MKSLITFFAVVLIGIATLPAQAEFVQTIALSPTSSIFFIDGSNNNIRTDFSDPDTYTLDLTGFSTSVQLLLLVIDDFPLHEYANMPDGLPMAREAPGNMFVSPCDACHNDHTTYMFSRWESEAAWDAYLLHRTDISPDWFLPMMEPEHILKLRELDSSPTINSTQAAFYGAPEGSVCNFHIWQFDDVDIRDEVNEFWGIEPGLASSVTYPGNIIVSAFEAVDKENRLVVISAWKSEKNFLAYRQMRRNTAPSLVRSFLVDEVMVRSKIVDPDKRAII
ncbi:MAG: quinol monooxygenase YgiN [Gammaproteobacteria bacterium]|jgi:quinol monooxygenase YgiN